MVDQPPHAKKSSLSNLPQWPEEAKDLPDSTSGPEPKRRFVWTFLFAVLGAFVGIAWGLRTGGTEAPGMSGYLVGAAGTAAFFSGCLGLLFDDLRFRREVSERHWRGK